LIDAGIHLEDSIFRSSPLKLWQERFSYPLQCRIKSSLDY
jgi:hypothetical protein